MQSNQSNKNHENSCHFTRENIEKIATIRSFKKGESLYFRMLFKTLAKKAIAMKVLLLEHSLIRYL